MKTSSTIETPGRARGVAASDDPARCLGAALDHAPEAVADAADQGTRQRVLTSILEHGPSTAVDLGERLALTPAAIRRHLAGLSEAGMVTSREQRVYGQRGRGRPAKVFLLTDAGRASFPQAYDRLANGAIELMLEAAGPELLRRLAEERVRDVEAAYQRSRVEQPDADPVAALAAALNETGYVTSIEPVASGQQLCQHHCPVARVAARHPELCVAETQLFGRLLTTHVQRLATIAHGEGVCTTHVPTVAVTPQLPARSGHSSGDPPPAARRPPRAAPDAPSADTHEPPSERPDQEGQA